MFVFPQLEDNNASRDYIERFAGYNHNLRINDGEFYDMQNMTGDYFPVLSPRSKRGFQKQLTNFQGMICKDSLCYVDNGHLYISGNEIEAFSNTTIADTRYDKVLVGMGAYLVIFNRKETGLQDGWYVNTENTSDNGFIDINKSITPNESISIKYITCMQDGTAYNFEDKNDENYVYISDEAPNTQKLRNGYKWLDTSSSTHYIKVWNKTNSMWSSLSTVYTKIIYPNIADGFNEGDGITISGAAVSPITNVKVEEQIKALNTTTLIKSIDTENKSWIVVVNMLDKVCNQTSGTLTVSRQAPYMDYICESHNRLWGCRYGLNRKGDIVNEIYACKQGDFKNWFCYAGISTDSYAVSIGSDDVWTGCIPFGSYILFFKEHVIHKIYGTLPSNYQVLESKVRGVAKGSEKSLCIVNETLFYKSTTDVCYYDGSLPTSISSQLGEVSYKNAVCGSIKSKLYINMQDSENVWNLFVYDISTGMWHKEDKLNCKSICRVDTDLYYVDENNRLCTFTGTGILENDFEWYAETGVIGYSYSDNKYVGRMLLRLQKPLTSKIRLLINYDNSSEWEVVSSFNGNGTQSFSVPVIPRRCDHFRLRIEGVGDCKIFSLSKTLEIGSDG